MTSFSPLYHNSLVCICFCSCICSLLWIFCLACSRLCVERLPAFHWDIGDIVYNFGCMICEFPKFSRIFSKFWLLIWYSNIRLTALYRFGIWYYWMFFMFCISELKCCFTNAIINFCFRIFPFGVILGLRKTLLVRHFSLIWPCCFLVQLHVHVKWSFGGLTIFLLWVLIMIFMLDTQP